MTRRRHEQRGACGESELPDRPGPREGRQHKQEIDADAFALRLSAKMDCDHRSEGESQTPVEIGDERGAQDRQSHYLDGGSGNARKRQHSLFEGRRRSQDQTQRQDQRHLHRECQQHPKPLVVGVDGRRHGIADRKRDDRNRDQQDDGSRDRIGHEPFYKPRKAVNPAFSQDVCSSLNRTRRHLYRADHGGHGERGERQYRSAPVFPVLPVVDLCVSISPDLTNLYLRFQVNFTESSLSSACSNQFVPFVTSSGRENSRGLWLMPETEGTKIIPTGESRDISCASWPAPLGMNLVVNPSCLAASSITRRTRTSVGAGGVELVCLNSNFVPVAFSICWTSSRIFSKSILVFAASRSRNPRLVVTLPGMTL